MFYSIYCYGFIPWVVSQFFFDQCFLHWTLFFRVWFSIHIADNRTTGKQHTNRTTAIRTRRQRRRYPEHTITTPPEHRTPQTITPPKTQIQHTANNYNQRDNTTPRTQKRHAIHIQRRTKNGLTNSFVGESASGTNKKLKLRWLPSGKRCSCHFVEI